VIKGEHRAVDGAGREPRLPHAGPAQMAIDRVSKAIIEQLQQDGRRSYAAIGRSVGLSEDAVLKRVTQLQEAGVMQIVAVTDPLQLGFARQAMIGVIVEGDLKPVAEALASIEEVDYVVITAGGFDILAEVVGQSDAHLLELVTSSIRPIPGVVSIHTFLYLELQKQTYTWGVHDPR
jgi:Lrp/AsnC family transcriptional regulator for asnA, asnC and gidA